MPHDTGDSTPPFPTRRRALRVLAGFAAALALAPGRGPFAAAPPAPQDDTGWVTIVPVSATGAPLAPERMRKVVKSEAEWRRQLSPLAFRVTRQAGTEAAYSGKYQDLHERGLFRCICCGTALFASETKFESHTGWPSFWAPLAEQNVVAMADDSFGMRRTAVSCRRCDAHLGHVFDDGPRPTGLRYCMNSVALDFAPAP